MDKRAHYRELIQTLLSEYSKRRSTDEVESQCNFDLQRDHYQVVNVGWSNQRRDYGCVMHFDIKGDKIWLQYNGTEIDLAERLVQMGVPRSDIVLGFQAPYRRKYTDYAVG